MVTKQTPIEEKVQICLDRVDNLSLREIAKRHDMSFQNVHLILSSLNNATSKKAIHETKLKRETCKKIFSLHYEGYSKKEISDILNVKAEDISDLYAFVTTRKSRKIESALYPVIADWANERDYSLTRLGKDCNIAPYRLGRILAGNSLFPMTKEDAKKLSKLTKIPLKEIFGELYERGKENDKGE